MFNIYYCSNKCTDMDGWYKIILQMLLDANILDVNC